MPKFSKDHIRTHAKIFKGVILGGPMPKFSKGSYKEDPYQNFQRGHIRRTHAKIFKGVI